MRRIVAAAFVLMVAVLPAPAQTPGDCTKAANEWRAAEFTKARAEAAGAPAGQRDSAQAKLSAKYSAIQAWSVSMARTCAAKIDIEHVPSSQLIDLVNLYAFLGDTANRRRATERAVAATDLSPRAHAQTMVFLVNQEIARVPNYFGIIDGAERVVREIDALPAEFDDIKLSAHTTMMGRYEYLDVDDGLRAHAQAVLDLARTLGKTDMMISAYRTLARAHADYLHPDSALMVLDQAEKELGTSPRLQSMFGDFRRRYALLGTPAAPVTGTWWLNTTAKPASVQPGQGRVLLVEFTAHWCMPCKNSYPGMRELAERFKGKPFEGVLVTSLYGFLGSQRNLTPDQEVAADEIYFTKEHELPYKVAINPSPRGGEPQVDVDYRVGGIPQIAIVDKQGVIRQIVTGWDRGNTERIGNLIQQLIDEK